MSSWANNAIITKAKAMYGNFLKDEDYERLTKMRSLPDLVGYLKKQKNYEQVLKDVQEASVHRGQLEALIRKNVFDSVLKLLKLVYSKDAEFFQLNIVKQENEIILAAIRSIISSDSDENRGKVPLFFNIHTDVDLEKIIKATTFDDLMQAVAKSDYEEILKPFYTKNPEMIRYLDIEHALEVYYYKEAFRRINNNYSGKLNKELTSIFETRIEISNIIKIYRLKKFYRADPVTIKSVLIKEYSRISEKKMDEIISLSDPDLILKYLSSSEYKRFTSDKDYVYVEYYAGKIKYDLAKKMMYFSTDVPKVYVAFIILAEIEIENIINIVEGIRYQVDENEIKQMLIY